MDCRRGRVLAKRKRELKKGRRRVRGWRGGTFMKGSRQGRCRGPRVRRQIELRKGKNYMRGGKKNS